MPTKAPAEAVFHVKKGWRVLTERFNWGGTEIPDKAYYELWYDKGFYCGSKIRQSNLENVCTHIFAANFIIVKMWNCSDPAQDVYFDFTVWYYTYQEQFHDKVMAILLKRDRLLEKILAELKRR